MSAVRSLPQKPQITFGKFSNVDLRVASVVSAPIVEGTAKPCRRLELDLGPLGRRISVGQYALVPEAELVGTKVIVCCNLGTREMGPHVSEALVLGVLHPDNPADQSQATPLRVDERALPGEPVF